VWTPPGTRLREVFIGKKPSLKKKTQDGRKQGKKENLSARPLSKNFFNTDRGGESGENLVKVSKISVLAVQ